MVAFVPAPYSSKARIRRVQSRKLRDGLWRDDSQGGFHHGEQLVSRERLGQDSVGLTVPGTRGRKARDQNDWNFRAERLDRHRQFVTIHFWHSPVSDDEIPGLFLKLSQPLRTIAGSAHLETDPL